MPDSPGKLRVARNSASALVLFGVNVVITFLLSPVIVRSLGNRDYGIWDLILSLCGYLGILEVGIGPAIIRFVAKIHAEGDEVALKKTMVTAASALGAAGLLSLIVMFLISLRPYEIFNISRDQSPYLRFLCVLAGCNLMVQFLGTGALAFLLGLQEHYRVNLLRTCLAIASAAAVYFALTRGGGSGLLWLSTLLLAGNLLQYTIFFGWAGKSLGKGLWSRRFFSWNTLKELFSFGFNSSLMMVADRIQRQSVPFVIGHTLGVATIVFYSIPSRLVSYGADLVSAMGFPLTPFFSASEVHGLAETRRTWLEANRWMGLLVMGMAAGIGILGSDFISIWMGPDYAQRGKWVILLLSASMLIEGLAPNSSRVLVALGRHYNVSRKLVALGVATVGLCVLGAWLWGLEGVALVVGLANLCAFIICFWQACRLLEVHIWRYVIHTARTLGPSVAVLGLSLVGLRAVAPPTNYAHLALEALAAAGLYVLFTWHFSLDSQSRKFVSGVVSETATRLSKGFVKA